MVTGSGTTTLAITASASGSHTPDGGVISANNTTSIVELDQLFNALNPRARKGLDDIIHGFADWYEGQERNANRTAYYFSPALAGGRRFFDEINRDSEVFEELLVESAKAMGRFTGNWWKLVPMRLRCASA